MTAPLARFAPASRLYVAADRTPGVASAGFLMAPGAATPASLSLADALAAQGWFVVTGALADADVPGFEAAAQIWFANSARAGALLGWFTNAPEASLPPGPGPGLAGWTFYARRAASGAALLRAAAIEFGNYTISMPPGTTVAASADGTALTFTAGAAPSRLAVTPFGGRRPLVLPATTAVTLILAGDPGLCGCLAFGITADSAAFDGLDFGLRSFSAPAGGGYAQTALHRVFDFSGLEVALAATLDPLAPLDHDRSFLAFTSPIPSVPSFYRSPVGGAYHAELGEGGRLVLGKRLDGVDAGGNAAGGAPVYSLVPSGTFPIALAGVKVPAPANGNPTPDLTAALMCGLSAVEYLGLPAGAILRFVPDQPAFAPTLPAAAGRKRVFGALTGAGTTAWAYLTGTGGSPYFAQADKAVLHQGMAATSPFLAYLPLQLATLPPLADDLPPASAYPLLPYASTVPGLGLDLDDLAEFERQAWAPARTARIRQLGTAPLLRRDEVGLPNPPAATTPQGLLLELGAGFTWDRLTLGVSSPPPPPDPPRQPFLAIANVIDPLKSALQANELFLVASAGDKFLASCSIPYLLTSERLDFLTGIVTDSDCLSRLTTLLDTLIDDEAELHARLMAAPTPAKMASYYDAIRGHMGEFSLFAAGGGSDPGWEFDLSPWRWPDHKTILIFKFCRKQLAQLVGDTSQWSRAEEVNADASATCQQMADLFAEARSRLAGPHGDTDLSYFVNTVLSDPDWNGILALNATVPLSGLPSQMKGIAAGIDAANFKAHHLGVTVTPVKGFTATPSSIFGLIEYEDPAALVSADNWQFKVNSLKVLIANSQIADFSSRIELLINQLFGEGAQQLNAADNNLSFNGYYQRSGGIGSYLFVTAGATAYRLSSSVLDQVAIVTATFVTLAEPDPDDTKVNAKFLLNGQIAFLPQPGFDLFSYGPEASGSGVEGGLAYRNLSIDMAFDEATPSYKQFSFDAAGIVLDAATSLARAASLTQHFPMKLTGLVQGRGTVTPDSLGFMPVDSPLQGSLLAAPWFGLRFDLDLGSPGALAAATGFTAGLLLGWAPNPSGASIYIGLTLPGVSGGKRAISLEGVLSLAFGDVRFVVAQPTYMIELSNIALKFLSVSFPPGGQISMFLFGNPDAQTSGALGWYAAYLKNGAAGGGSSGQNFLLAPASGPLPTAEAG